MPPIVAFSHRSVRLNFKPSDESAQPTKTSNELQNHCFFTNPNQNPQNEKIRVFWVMILKNLPINPRDVGMAILLLVYMPTLGAGAIVVASPLIAGISMAIPLLFSITFMLKYNWFFVCTHIEWLPRKIHMIVSSRGVHAVRDQYASRHDALKASVALLFYMPIMGMIGIGIVMIGDNIVTAIVGGSIALISWFVTVTYGMSMMLDYRRYFLYLHTRCIPETIASSIRKYNARRQYRNELLTKRTPI